MAQTPSVKDTRTPETKECPKHPGQPFYRCPLCSKLHKQEVGRQIVSEMQESYSCGAGEENSLVPDPLPVRVTRRAADHLLAAVRDFRRHRVEGKIQSLRKRLQRLESAGPERDATLLQLHRLEESATSEEVAASDTFDAVVLIFIDETGVSGMHPKIELGEPDKIEGFSNNYQVYEYSGALRVAVELQNMSFLRGLVVDWVDRLDRSGFSITHPRVGVV